MTKYSQRNSEWKEFMIGDTTSTLGRYGCLITCLGMMTNIKPHIVEDSLHKVGGFQKDLILWQKITKAKLGLEFVWRAYVYDNQVVKETIKEFGRCMVEVDWDGSPKTTGKHWVLFIGNGRMIDPWTGRECSTNKYPLLTGFAIIKPSKLLEELPQLPMTKDEERALEAIRKFKKEAGHGNLEGAVNASIGAWRDLETNRGLLKTSEELRKNAEKLTKKLNLKLVSETGKQVKLAKLLKTANKQIKKLIVEKDAETKQKNQYRKWWDKAKKNDITKMNLGQIIIVILKRFKPTENVKKK